MKTPFLLTVFNNHFNKQPVIWGVSDTFQETIDDLNLLVGAVDKDFTACPGGQIRVITNVSFMYTGTAPGFLNIGIWDGSTFYNQWASKAPTTATPFDRQVFWVIKPNYKIRVQLRNATATNDLLANIHGYIMKVQ